MSHDIFCNAPRIGMGFEKFSNLYANHIDILQVFGLFRMLFGDTVADARGNIFWRVTEYSTHNFKKKM